MVFPAGFLWGTALSAHQTEGHNTNSDWWAWEQSPQFSGREPSGRATGHWERYREDFALARDLGLNAQRISIEWARIEPEPGRWSEAALGHYREVLEYLKQQGFTTFVSLHHYTNPRWLAERGGWQSREVVGRFQRYAEAAARELGPLVDFWTPINEPIVYILYSYVYGVWPPQKRSVREGWPVFRNMIRGHRAAYRAIHRALPNARVGTAHLCVAFEPARANGLDRIMAALRGWGNNQWYLRSVRDSLDFLGVNYYFCKRVRASARAWRGWFSEFAPPTGPQNDLGWEIFPDGLYQQLLHLKKYRLPVYITENGLADAEDRQRAGFIRDHLQQVARARDAGVDVRGYLHWSLTDNYEWHLGFAPRFGLAEVDYQTLERRLRPSAAAYREIARANGLEGEK